MPSYENTLDARVGALYRRNPAGDIGIEIELEGSLPPSDNQIWTHKAEGSLRNGMEYVLSRPIKIDKITEATKMFEGFFKGSLTKRYAPVKSIRCSTHFHVNVCSLSQREVYNVLGTYAIVEDLLVRTQGPLRIGNVFCLRMSDANGILSDIQRSIYSKDFFTGFSMNQNKYGAVNLATVAKFGSLEFRFFRPMVTSAELDFWSAVLYQLVHNSKSVPISKRISDLERLNPLEFLSTIFNPQAVEKIVEGLSLSEIETLLGENIDLAHEIDYAMKDIEKPRKYQISPHARIREGDLDDGSFGGTVGHGGISWSEISNSIENLQAQPMHTLTINSDDDDED